MSRKVIQITSGPVNDGENTVLRIVALCDDGSMWSIIEPNTGEWNLIPPIPGSDDVDDVDDDGELWEEDDEDDFDDFPPEAVEGFQL